MVNLKLIFLKIKIKIFFSTTWLSELDNELGYFKYSYKNKLTSNYISSFYPKTVSSTIDEFNIDVPKGCSGDYEPQIVKKYQTNIAETKNKILFMLSQCI